jgi:hypothetical protein
LIPVLEQKGMQHAEDAGAEGLGCDLFPCLDEGGIEADVVAEAAEAAEEDGVAGDAIHLGQDERAAWEAELESVALGHEGRDVLDDAITLDGDDLAGAEEIGEEQGEVHARGVVVNVEQGVDALQLGPAEFLEGFLFLRDSDDVELSLEVGGEEAAADVVVPRMNGEDEGSCGILLEASEMSLAADFPFDLLL